MGRNRFVDPDITRLPLSDGDYIDIKRRLNVGEQTDLFAEMSPTLTPGEKAHLDTREVGVALAVAYLVGWSFMRTNKETGESSPVPYNHLTMSLQERKSTVKLMDGDDFAEMRKAIEAHIEANDKAVSAEKNGQAGPNAPGPS